MNFLNKKRQNETALAKRKPLSDTNLLLVITISVFAAMYLLAVIFLGAGFRKPQTFLNLLNENASLIVLSCALSLVMITGGIDISVGTVTALVCMCCAVHLDKNGGTIAGAVIYALVIGVSFGLVQGFLVAFLDIQPFIVSLAGMFFAKGMTTIVNATQFNVKHEGFVKLIETRIYVPGMGSVNKVGKYIPAYVEPGVLIALLVVVILFLVLRWTKARTQLLRCRRKPAEREHARNQRQDDKIPCALHLLGSCGGRRIRVLHARRFGFPKPCKRLRNERNRIFDYRRNNAHGRSRKHRGNILRRAFTCDNQEHRLLART